MGDIRKFRPEIFPLPFSFSLNDKIVLNRSIIIRMMNQGGVVIVINIRRLMGD